MIRLQGMTWDHRRAIEPLAALDAAFARERPDVALSWRSRPLAGFEFDPIERLAAENDFVIFDHPFCGRIAAAGCFLSVSELLAGAGGARAFVGPSVRSYDYAGGHWGVPVDGACQIAVFRQDLMERLDAEVPATWDEACLLGEKAARAGMSLAIALHGVHSLMTFFSLCAAMGAPYAGDECGVEEKAAREALGQMRRLAALCPAEALSWNSIALHEALAGSDTLIYCPAVYGYAAYGEADRTPRLAFGPFAGADGALPCRGSTIGGAGLGISVRVKREPEVHAAALAYARVAADGGTQTRVFAAHHGQPAHVDSWHDPSIDNRFNGFFSATRATMAHAWIRPRHDGYLRFQAEAGGLVEAHLRGDLAERRLLDRLRVLDAECRSSEAGQQ